MSHIDVKQSWSKTDHYCLDGSIEIALQTFVREKRYFCNCLALRSCSWAIAALESHLSFIFTATETCKKENVFKVLKVLLPIRLEGIIWGPLQHRPKSNTDQRATQSLDWISNWIRVSSINSSTQYRFQAFPPYKQVSKLVLSLLSHSQLHPWRKNVLRSRGQRKEVAEWWWLELN